MNEALERTPCFDTGVVLDSATTDGIPTTTSEPDVSAALPLVYYLAA